MLLSYKLIGIGCIVIALFLEMFSYYRQIAKTLKTKRSAQVSSSAYEYKLAKYVVTIIGLAIYSNWVGLGLEVAALSMCLVAFAIIIKYKPKKWRLWR